MTEKNKPIERQIGTVYMDTEGKRFFKKAKSEVEFEKSSKQLNKEKRWIGQQELIPHPSYSFDSLYTLFEHCEVFASCVCQIAEDVAGLGWKLILKDDPNKEGEKFQENKEEKQKIMNFLNRPNAKQSLRQIFISLLQARGIVGFGGIEVVRNLKGEIADIYAIRGTNLYIHEDRNKYCQKVGLKKVWFKDFGYDKNVNSETGEEGNFGFKQRANELIFFGTDYGKSSYYPIPKILPSVSSVVCLLDIKSYNLSFFANYSVPAYAVILEGEWDEDASQYITQFLNTEVKGSDNANKTIVLTTPEGGKVTFKALSIDEKEGSFKAYQVLLEDDILLAHSMPPYRLGRAVTGNLGGSNSREATAVYKQSVVEPIQEYLENIVNISFIEKGLNCFSYLFRFNDLDVRDLDGEVIRYNSSIQHGTMTPNEVREKLNLGEPYPEGDKYYISNTLGEAGVEEIETTKGKLVDAVDNLRKDMKRAFSEEDEL